MYNKIAGLMLAVVFVMTGCKLDPSQPYEFRQETTDISRIDILLQNDVYTSWDDRFSIAISLEASQYLTFVNELMSIKGQPFFNPPATSFDRYVIRISYLNGDEEYISCNNNAYRVSGSEVRLDTYWFSDKEAFNNLILKYIRVDRTRGDPVY